MMKKRRQNIKIKYINTKWKWHKAHTHILLLAKRLTIMITIIIHAIKYQNIFTIRHTRINHFQGFFFISFTFYSVVKANVRSNMDKVCEMFFYLFKKKHTYTFWTPLTTTFVVQQPKIFTFIHTPHNRHTYISHFTTISKTK